MDRAPVFGTGLVEVRPLSGAPKKTACFGIILFV